MSNVLYQGSHSGSSHVLRDISSFHRWQCVSILFIIAELSLFQIGDPK